MRWIEYENKKPTDAFADWEPWTEEEWENWLDKSAGLLEQMAALDAEAAALNVAGDAESAKKKIAERNSVIDSNSAHWGKLKPWLLALSYGKCWFSESKDIYSHYEVEHFRPKKVAKNMPGDVARDGYWWLAFEYSNFRICGNVGNRKKGGWFTLKEGSLCSTFGHRCEEAEMPFLIDPTDPADVELLAFDEEGNAIPSPGISEWQGQRVNVSIERLKLNTHEALTDARRALWQEVSREIEKYLAVKQQCGSGDNPVACDRLRNQIRKIHRLGRAQAPLSSVVRWCLSFRDDPQLRCLVVSME